MLSIPSRHAHPNAAARFVPRLRISEFFVVRVVHPKRKERRLPSQSATINKDLDHISTVQDELAKRVWLLPIALFDPRIMLRQRQHLTWPHWHHAKARLQKMRVHETAHLIHGRF